MARIVLLWCWLLTWQVPGLAAETLVIPGTGSSEAILKELAGAFNAAHPGKEVIIPPSIGSRSGLRTLLSDQCVLARIVVPPDNKIDPNLQYRVFATDALIFAVGAKVMVNNLTLAQLAAIFSGKITNWQDLGGPAGPIRVLIRDPMDSILQSIQFYFEEFNHIRFAPDSKVAYHDAEMVNLLKKYHNGIGMATGSGIHAESSVKALALDGIAPSAANLKNGNYRASLAYALAFKKGSLPELAQNFLHFAFSNEARALIADYGLIPAEPK